MKLWYFKMNAKAILGVQKENPLQYITGKDMTTLSSQFMLLSQISGICII